MNKDKFFVWCAVKRHLKSSTIRHTRVRYNYLFRWLGRKKLTKDAAELFVLHLREKPPRTRNPGGTKKGLSNSSINGYIRVIKLIDQFERENGNDINLMKKIDYFPKQETAPTILNIDEIEILLSCEIPFIPKRNGMSEDRIKKNNNMLNLTLWVLISTGCRFDEMASLKKENLSLGVSEGWVEFKKTKTGDDRKVPIPPILIDKLKIHVKDKKPTDLIFTSTRGNKLIQQTYNPHLRKLADIAGLSGKHIHAHCFRHSYIMEHRRRGTDPLTVAKLVGHRDVNSTLRYGRFDYDELLRGAENHSLFSKSISATKVLQKYEELIEKWPLKNDPRFEVKIEKSRNKFVFEVRIPEKDSC